MLDGATFQNEIQILKMEIEENKLGICLKKKIIWISEDKHEIKLN